MRKAELLREHAHNQSTQRERGPAIEPPQGKQAAQLEAAIEN